MSCGSTANSTNTLGAASRSFPDFGWSWKIPLTWLTGLVMWWEQRRQHQQLLDLDDRMLADIGISRTTVEKLRGSQLHMTDWRDGR